MSQPQRSRFLYNGNLYCNYRTAYRHTRSSSLDDGSMCCLCVDFFDFQRTNPPAEDGWKLEGRKRTATILLHIGVVGEGGTYRRASMERRIMMHHTRRFLLMCYLWRRYIVEEIHRYRTHLCVPFCRLRCFGELEVDRADRRLSALGFAAPHAELRYRPDR